MRNTGEAPAWIASACTAARAGTPSIIRWRAPCRAKTDAATAVVQGDKPRISEDASAGPIER